MINHDWLCVLHVIDTGRKIWHRIAVLATSDPVLEKSCLVNQLDAIVTICDHCDCSTGRFHKLYWTEHMHRDSIIFWGETTGSFSTTFRTLRNWQWERCSFTQKCSTARQVQKLEFSISEGIFHKRALLLRKRKLPFFWNSVFLTASIKPGWIYFQHKCKEFWCAQEYTSDW